MGDYIDVASPSNRSNIKSITLYDSIEDLLEQGTNRLVEEFLDIVKGTEGRWLGLLEGHHFFEFRDGTTSDTKIASILKAPFLGTSCFLRLRFNRGGSRHSLVIWAHHGAGGGMKQSAPLNRLENIVTGFDADIYLMGHQHKKVPALISQLYMTDNIPHRLKERTKYIASTGGFFQGYKQGSKVGNKVRGSYVEKKMYPPTALGTIIIRVKPCHQAREDSLKISIEI